MKALTLAIAATMALAGAAHAQSSCPYGHEKTVEAPPPPPTPPTPST